jgi:hypothetical protein
MRWLVVVVMVSLLTACAAGSELSPQGATPSPSPEVSTSPSEGPSPEPSPSPSQPTSRAERLAGRLTNVDANLKAGIGRWLKVDDGQPRGKRFKAIELLGLKKQKMMRTLVKRASLSRRVLPKLGPILRLEAKRNIKASRWLYKLTPPLKPKDVKLKTSRADHPMKLVRYYKAAQRRFGVQWSVLAAINLVESRMGRINGPSSAGALGPMQFMPATWDAYGKGDPFKPYNAIMAAARYLAANGAPERPSNALWNYNHSDYYVNGVVAYHRHMAAHPNSYFSYYLWQVFARTTKGDMQLTGPGNTYPY